MNERDLALTIERWFEAEAEEAAACPVDAAVCRRPHVMEEAVRPEPGGPIIACTVNGRVLAEKLAAHLLATAKAELKRMEELALASLSGGLPLPPELTFRREWKAGEPYLIGGHRQGCGARTDPSKQCICRLDEPVGRVTEETFRQEREGKWPPLIHGAPPPGAPPRPDEAERRCRGLFGGDGCVCITPQEHFKESP